ncbi:interleukin-13 receptor subunit alpha-1-like [Cheilinus undulatus]|uniref:interleukin-13 receptor subunit alpha-1-like n=1 Tax=Cheilinus undulatus TaxID=241271 RepID=UPI001BD267DB|nr:interleukin-13 receptor subunit alpha-1-like [Cheilinus undulatus]
MFKSVDLVFLCCLFLVVECLAGKIQPPQNLSLSWYSDFQPQLNWTSPPHSVENCRYEVESAEIRNEVKTLFWRRFRVMEGGKLNLSVRTLCGQEKSDWVLVTTSYPDLVENFTCTLKSSQLTKCTWNKANNTQDLRFYYQLFDESSRDETPLTECSLHRYYDNVKTDCYLKATTSQTMNILLNGTVDNKPVRNTFRRLLLKNVKLRPLDWNVTKDNNLFVIRWSRPDINDRWTWTYKIKYTKCNEENERRQKGGTSLRLDIVPQCRYRMQIKATLDYSLNGIETPWSEFKYLDAEPDPNAMLYAEIIIPLIVAGLALFIFMCYRKNKDRIFPKIPEPRDLLSDISDNNNKSTLHYLHVEEEDTCRITLVMDPHTEKTIS